MSRPEWLVPGTAVVEFTPKRSGYEARLVPTTIERVLKRDVVLANGHRFNADSLVRRAASAWDPNTSLYRADDERVIRAEQANHVATLNFRARVATDALSAALRKADSGRADTAAMAKAVVAAADAVNALIRAIA